VFWTVPARYSSAEEYTFYDSFPVSINEPAGIAYDTVNKSLYIAERGTRCIFEISKAGFPRGTIFVDVKKIADMTFSPRGEGGFFITQGERGEILETDRHGCLRRTFQLPENLQKEKIKAVTINPENGRVFVVTEGGQDGVLEMTLEGSCKSHVSFKDIKGIDAVHYDPISHHLLLLCSGKSQLYEATSEGEVIDNLPLEAVGAEGVTRDEAGLLYVLCEKSKRVYVYIPKKG
ncbi:MAG: SdiA-regulated domain-containing protein, partial [Candidatus Brocadiales bacterium]